jgi:hypothetical protein
LNDQRSRVVRIPIDRSRDGMDTLAAFDNAVEKLLETPPIETLPEQLAKLRFLFEEEFDKLWLDGAMRVEITLRGRRR